MPVYWMPEHVNEPDEPAELRSQVAAAKLAHCLRMAHNGASTHPDLREPDYDDADMLAASEDAEPSGEEP